MPPQPALRDRALDAGAVFGRTAAGGEKGAIDPLDIDAGVLDGLLYRGVGGWERGCLLRIGFEFCTPRISPFTCYQPYWAILVSMGTRPDTSVRALHRRHDALLTIWLAFVDELDNPVRPRAAEFPQGQEQRLGRDTSTRGLSRIRAANCSLLVHSAEARRSHR